MRKGLKVKYSVVLNRLQNLINYVPSQAELCNICKTKQSTMSNRANRDSDIPSDEIVMINDYYGINLYAEEVPSNNNSVTIDYYPDIFGSCGNGVFELSPEKTQIIVPKNAFFEKFSPNKTYSVINAHGNSMQPLIFDRDKLIVEHWNGEQKNETNKPTNVGDYKILKDYAVKHNAKNINAYINFLKKSGSDKQIIKDYKQAKANNKAMLEAVKQNQKDLEFAKQNAWQVPEGFFENIRSQITKNPTSLKMQGSRKEDLLLEE